MTTRALERLAVEVMGCKWVDGREEGLTGYGATKYQAVRDLLEQLAEEGAGR